MSPFDETRYARLLKGLEIAEVRLSQLEFSGRLDSEYYRPSHLRADELILSKGGEALESLCDFVIGPFGSAFTVENYTDEPTYRYIRGKDVKPMTLAEGDNVYMPKADFDRLSKYALRAGDVLVSVVGTLGNSALIEPQHLPAIFSCKSTALRTRGIDPRYLISYLNCALGRGLLMRKERGAVQKGLNLDDLKSLAIYVAGRPFQKKIAEVHKDSSLAREQAKQFYDEAETALLRVLGLENWQAPETLSYVRNSSQAFAAERFDAEYFHPAKTEALAKLSVLSDCTVGDLFNSVRELWQPDDDSGPDAVRNYDLTDALNPFLDGSKEPSDRTTIASTKKMIRAGDLVVSRLRSYLKEIALVQSGGKVPMVASTEFIVLRPKQSGGLPVEALMIFLRSALPQTVFMWSQDGSNHPRFDEKELLRLPLPRVLIQQASEYVAAVRAVISKRERATQLLDATKRAVEIAIEDSEAAALTYLETIAANAPSCDDAAHDLPTNPASQSTTPGLARPAPGRRQPARGVSGQGAGFHAELDGAGKRAGGPAAPARSPDSTQPLDATRTLATVAGPLPYSEVAEALAENVARCLDELFETAPENITLTPETLRAFHQRIAGALFPDWAGTWRTTEVQVGSHYPPPPQDVAVQVRNFCLDLEERLRHMDDAQSIAALLAWADWRFQWIHPFKDFNGRVGRILLVALTYRLGLPPLDPAGSTLERQAYFDALRQADGGDPHPLTNLWMERLQERMDSSDTSQ